MRERVLKVWRWFKCIVLENITRKRERLWIILPVGSGPKPVSKTSIAKHNTHDFNHKTWSAKFLSTLSLESKLNTHRGTTPRNREMNSKCSQEKCASVYLVTLRHLSLNPRCCSVFTCTLYPVTLPALVAYYGGHSCEPRPCSATCYPVSASLSHICRFLIQSSLGWVLWVQWVHGVRR